MSRLLFVTSFLTLTLALAACRSGPLWLVPDELRVSDRAVANAFDDVPAAARAPSPSPQQIPNVPMPERTRPCCAFGTDLRASLGDVPIPGYSIDNIRSVADLGPHRYDNGTLTLAMNDERGWVDQENNGLVYTCRGGFIDTAHVRDYADLTLYLTMAIAQRLAVGGEIPISHEGGTRRVVLHPVDPAVIARFGSRANDVSAGRFAAEVAAWIAFQASIWHEIATWYGYQSFEGFPEKLSAFSPEDLYSNQVGVRIARAILRERGLVEAASYDRRLDVWLRRSLRLLGATSKPVGIAEIHAVDGSWWDSTRRVPDWRLVRRRSFQLGPAVEPLIPYENGSVRKACDDLAAPLALEVRDNVAGLRFEEIATLEVEADPALVDAGLEPADPDTRHLSQVDFPRIVDSIRRENDAAFGFDGVVTDPPAKEHAGGGP